MRSALATGLLGIAFLFAAALVDAEPLWVPGIVLLVLAAGSVVWVALAARGVTVRRTLGAARVVEDEPLSIVLDVRAGALAAAVRARARPAAHRGRSAAGGAPRRSRADLGALRAARPPCARA